MSEKIKEIEVSFPASNTGEFRSNKRGALVQIRPLYLTHLYTTPTVGIESDRASNGIYSIVVRHVQTRV